VLALREPDQLRPVRVRHQPGAPDARREQARRGGEA